MQLFCVHVNQPSKAWDCPIERIILILIYVFSPDDLNIVNPHYILINASVVLYLV